MKKFRCDHVSRSTN